MKKKIITITLLTTMGLAGGLGGEYIATDQKVNEFKANLEVYEIAPEIAQNIAEYRKGGIWHKRTLNPAKGEHRAYINACNTALEIYRRLTGRDINFGGGDQERILKVCDTLISDEMIKTYRSSL